MNPEAVYWKLKLVVAGPKNAGKSALVYRFCTNTFRDNLKATIGTQFFTKNMTVDATNVKLQIWDFAGEDHFQFIFKEYCKGASGALVCFARDDYESFKKIQAWLQIVKDMVPDIPIILVANKADLEPSVEMETVADYAARAGCIGARPTSSKTGENIESMFTEITELMVEHVKKKAWQ